MPDEFGFIDDLRRKYALSRVGDDCAVLPKDAATELVVTADLLVEDVDFRRDWMSPQELGRRALAVSLSDVAAMGASPVWSMTSIGVPATLWETGFGPLFYEGYMALAREFGVELVGGDVSQTPDKVVVDSTVAGEVEKGRAVLRSGARPGDLIFVSGPLGGAAGGLELLFGGARAPGRSLKTWEERLVRRQLAPRPQVALGRALGRRRIASAMIDLSDGLSSDLAHLCRASGVGARIDAEAVPLDANLEGLGRSFDARLALALDGGEDFELLFTVAPEIFFARRKWFEKRRFAPLGEITANAGIIELIAGGAGRVLEPGGFRHF